MTLSVRRGVKQTAYRIFVSTDPKNLDVDLADIWDSEKIETNNSIQVFYKGKSLESNQRYYWKVKVWDQDGMVHSSKPAFWTTGLFNEADWKAKWIGLDRHTRQLKPNILYAST